MITPERIAELRKSFRSWHQVLELLDEIERLRAESAQLARLRGRLERLRPLSEAATDAPWEEIDTPSGQGATPMANVYQNGGDCETVALMVGARDATFIAASRNEIAAMLEDTKP